MLKAAIVLNVILLLVAVVGLILALKNGEPIADHWMLPFFGVVLLVSLIDAARQRAQAKK